MGPQFLIQHVIIKYFITSDCRFSIWIVVVNGPWKVERASSDVRSVGVVSVVGVFFGLGLGLSFCLVEHP